MDDGGQRFITNMRSRVDLSLVLDLEVMQFDIQLCFLYQIKSQKL
jgi:hypothetical protein